MLRPSRVGSHAHFSARKTLAVGRTAVAGIVAVVALLTLAGSGVGSSASASGGQPASEAQNQEPSEVVGLRTATSDTYAYLDGTYAAHVFSGPINYRPQLGSWEPIDSRLVPATAAGFAYANAGNSFTVDFADHAVGGYSQFNAGDGPVSLSLVGLDQAGLSSAPAAVTAPDRGELVYPNVEPGVNLAYLLTPVGLKESIVLKDASARPSYSFQLSPQAGQQLTAKRLEDGSWAFYSGTTGTSGTPVFWLAAPAVSESLPPFMPSQCSADPNGGPPLCLGAPAGPTPASPAPAASIGVEDGTGAVSHADHVGSLQVTPDADGFRVDLAVDPAWLASSDRVFPVVIDPTVILSGSGSDQDATFEQDCSSCTPTMASSSNQHIQVGGDGTHTYEAASLFNLSSIPSGSSIVSAGLNANFDTCFPPASYSPGGNGCTWVWPYQALTLNAHRITNSWSSTTTTAGLGVDSSVIAALPITLGYPGVGIAPGTLLTWDMTKQVQEWVSQAQANYGVVLQETSMCGGYSSYCGINVDDSYDSTASLRPYLAVTYEPRLGTDSRWPMWSSGPLAVNETTGNLVVSLPTPSFPTAAGTLSVPITFNELDPATINHPLGTGWTIGSTTWLVDHAMAGDGTGIDVFAGDRSSILYLAISGSTVYQATDGSNSQLTKNTDGSYTLIDGDGSVTTYAAANSSGLAQPSSLQSLSANQHTGEIDDTFDGSGRLTAVTAKDGSTTIAQITLTWNGGTCSAMVCIKGPDGQNWTYTADTSGRLQTVNDGTRDLLKITYDSSGRPQTIQNADDLASSSSHNVTVSYDSANRVSSISQGPITGQTPSTSTWTFGYHPDPSGTTTTDASMNHGAARAAAGYTTITPPCEQSTTTCSGHTSAAHQTVYYDAYGYPMEKVELPDQSSTQRHTLQQYNSAGQLLWTEDEDGNPTDYTYDAVDGTQLTVARPDPDAGGSMTRPVTTYNYDETAYGSVAGSTYTPGTALYGLQADYYTTPNFVSGSTAGGGRPDAIETDVSSGSFSYTWGATGPPALFTSGSHTNYSVRFVGDLNLSSAQTLAFDVSSDRGTELTLDDDTIESHLGAVGQNSQISGGYSLAAGKHRIVLKYTENGGGSSDLSLLWCNLSGSTCATGSQFTAIPSSALTPAWGNQTSTASPAGRVTFSHFNQPWTALSDYSLAYAPLNGTSSPLITNYTHDGFGRLTGKVLPNGNTAAILSSGTLTNPGDPLTSNYGTVYAYYGDTDTATTPASLATGCLASATVSQLGLLKSITQHGLHAVTTVYDIAGRPVSSANATGSTVSCYSAEGRQLAAKTPGDSQPTTFSYDPNGSLLTAAHSGTSDDTRGTVTNSYDEAGRLVDTIDASGAEAAYTYDASGNLTNRIIAKGSLGTSTHYTTTYSYDDADQLTSQTNSDTSKTWSFYYDDLGNLRGIQYPNTTFSWTATNPDGWTTGVYDRHGTINSSTLPTDTLGSTLGDYMYSYNADGQKTQVQITVGSGSAQTTQYTYDSIGRLQQIQPPSGTACTAYYYDSDSNRTQTRTATNAGSCGTFSTVTSYSYTTGTYTPVDALTAVGSTTYTYAGAGTSLGDGQLTSRGTDTLTWDGSIRVNAVSHSGNTACYLYDSNGNLLTRTYKTSATNCTTPAGTTNYLLGDLLETNASTTITASYEDSLAGDLSSYNGAPTSASTATYLYYDDHGNEVNQATSTGAQTGTSQGYDPFGNVQVALPANSAIHAYTGRWNKESDTTTGLILMGARPYDPVIGRFLAVDPIDGGSLNNYDYAGQDPINGYDLSGLAFVCPDCGGGAAVGGILPGAGAFGAAGGTAVAIGAAAAAVVTVCHDRYACIPVLVEARGGGKGHAKGENKQIDAAARRAGLNQDGRGQLQREIEDAKQGMGRGAKLPNKDIQELADDLAQYPKYRR